MNISKVDLRPQPHPMLGFLRERGIPILRIMPYLGVSYTRVWQILSGYSKAKPDQEEKLEALRLSLIDENKTK